MASNRWYLFKHKLLPGSWEEVHVLSENLDTEEKIIEYIKDSKLDPRELLIIYGHTATIKTYLCPDPDVLFELPSKTNRSSLD